ncbi:hypothetical protein [Treponema sp.]|uniref:hypothetical protein n=1 Tax=Treponema sp. TaxID=166 RepID=UPI003890AC63
MKIENEKLKNILLAFTSALFLTFALVSCADANGLHNQEAATVTFVFTNFPVADGSYSIPGDHNSWDNTSENITIKGGEGTSAAVKVTSSSIEFSLVKKDNWLRPWSNRDGGSINGAGRTGTDYAVNFLAEGIELGSEVTVTIDGSTPTATVTVE